MNYDPAYMFYNKRKQYEKYAKKIMSGNKSEDSEDEREKIKQKK